MIEKDVETCIRRYLKDTGWCVKNRVSIRGIDIEACKNNEGRKAIIEVKGCGAHTTAMGNNFRAVFGQILNDMTDPNAEYYVAFPKIEPYIRLWGNLPQLAKKRTGIKVIWVEGNGNISGI